jgi:hypothetical protein
MAETRSAPGYARVKEWAYAAATVPSHRSRLRARSIVLKCLDGTLHRAGDWS